MSISSISGKTTTKLTTPQILQRGMYLVWGASVLLLVASIATVQGQRNAIRTIGKDTAPSIINAQRLKDALSGMKAFAANELLAPAGQNEAAAQGYRERYQRLSERLVSVAENITYGDKERKPIQTLQLGVGDYIAQLQQARDFNAQHNTVAMLNAYRQASNIMDKTLLPAADALDKANLDELDRIYSEQKVGVGRSLFFITIVGLATLIVLIGLQILLSRRTRRTLNLGLLAATAIATIFLLYILQVLTSSSNSLQVAKEGAFDSIHALRQMRSLAYGAVADESSYLLDPAFARQNEQAFLQKIAQIATPPTDQTFASVASAIARSQSVPNFTGLLATEANNITFPGEREAVVETISKLGNYLEIDKQIRQLQQSGKHQEAVALINNQIREYHLRLLEISNYQPQIVCAGADAQSPNCALTQLMDANLKTYAVNKKVFYQEIGRGFNAVGGYSVIMPPDDRIEQLADIQPQAIDQFTAIASTATAAIALLTLLGLLPRLREYSAWTDKIQQSVCRLYAAIRNSLQNFMSVRMLLHIVIFCNNSLDI